MSVNGIGSTAVQASATASTSTSAPSHSSTAQASQAGIKTLYGSPGAAEGLANTLQRMQQLLQPAQAHIKAAHPDIQ